MRIAVVADFAPTREGAGLAQGIESMGAGTAKIDGSQDYPAEYVLRKHSEHKYPLRDVDKHLFCGWRDWGGYCLNARHAQQLVYGHQPVYLAEVLPDLPDVDAVLITQPQFVYDIRGVQVPVFFSRQVLSKAVPGANTVPSGTVTSATQAELSRHRSGCVGAWGGAQGRHLNLP